jgi:phosphatidylglycerophosphate synthase
MSGPLLSGPPAEPALPNEITRAVERVSMWLAVLMTLALSVSVALGRSEPTAVAALVGVLGVAAYLARVEPPASWLPTGVTFVRLVITVWLGLVAADLNDIGVVAIVLVVFILDTVDGYLARRLGAVSVMGGHLDGETDAVLTALVCLFLYLRGFGGAWVLTAGYLRFVYVLVVHFFPSHGHAPRSRLAARAFGIALVGLLLGYLRIPYVSAVTPALATLLLCWSFGRSFYWSFRGAPAQPAQLP